MLIDTNHELQLLDELGRELAAMGVRNQVRDDLHALAVATGTPGVHVWVFISPSGLRYSCYLDNLREYLTSDPECAAREIAAFVRGLMRA